jgi:hypothetical protein
VTVIYCKALANGEESPMEHRSQYHQALKQLDPVRDNNRICRYLAGYEFPWDLTRALELALFRTFCIPSIAALLDQTGEFHHRPHLGYSVANQRVGQSTLALFLSWFPPPLRPLVKPLVYAVMDDGMLEAFGFPQPQPWQRSLVTQILRWRGYLLCYLPLRQTPRFYSEEPQRSYPQGYHLSDLGPPGLLPQLNRPTKPSP